MPDPVYTTSESGGKSGPVLASVYEFGQENQQDTRNHNPRVGGSSPSSATIQSAEICGFQNIDGSEGEGGLHATVNRTCAMYRWLPDCARDNGAHPTDPICAGFVSAATAVVRKDQPK